MPRWTGLHRSIVEKNYDHVEWWLRVLPLWEVMLPSPFEDRADRAVQDSWRQQAVGMPVQVRRCSSLAGFVIALRRLCLVCFFGWSLYWSSGVCVYIVVAVVGLCVYSRSAASEEEKGQPKGVTALHLLAGRPIPGLRGRAIFDDVLAKA